MNKKYPPDADVTDVFDLDEEQINSILEAYDNDPDVAEELSIEFGLTNSEYQDLLEWFNR